MSSICWWDMIKILRLIMRAAPAPFLSANLPHEWARCAHGVREWHLLGSGSEPFQKAVTMLFVMFKPHGGTKKQQTDQSAVFLKKTVMNDTICTLRSNADFFCTLALKNCTPRVKCAIFYPHFCTPQQSVQFVGRMHTITFQFTVLYKTLIIGKSHKITKSEKKQHCHKIFIPPPRCGI